MLIFGFGPGQAEDLGEVAPAVCPYCHNPVFFHQVQSKKSVRLYFVPVVPYGTDDYLLCPICSRGLQLSAQQVPVVSGMRSVTANHRRGAMPSGYDDAVGRFWAQIGVHPDTGAQVLHPAPAPQVTAPAVLPDGDAHAARARLSWLEELDELDQLHREGVLTDESYEKAKARVLGREDGAAPHTDAPSARTDADHGGAGDRT